MMHISENRKLEIKITYDRLMLCASGREFIKGVHERHHIIPKSLGGTNDKSNIVFLTYREHFLAHWLLAKFTSGADQKKMLHALFRISGKCRGQKTRSITSWQYKIARESNRKAMIGAKPSKETREKLSKARIGNQNGKGYKHKPESCDAIRKGLAGNKNAFGHKHSEEVKAKISKSNFEEKHWRSKPVLCLNDNREFPCANAAARFYNIPNGDIGAVCRGSQKSARGMRFEYMQKAS